MSKKIHIAISTDNLSESIKDYNKRLSALPTIIVDNQYALWETETVNFSVRVDKNIAPGSLRHLGWQDSTAEKFTEEIDVNGITWERFNRQNQLDEINQLMMNQSK
ncbi:MAG: hypothetical protein ACXITR_02500 [Cyanobacterium sp.]